MHASWAGSPMIYITLYTVLYILYTLHMIILVYIVCNTGHHALFLFTIYLTLILLRLFQQHDCYNVTGQ